MIAKLANIIPNLNEREVRDRHYVTRILLGNKTSYEEAEENFIAKRF